MIQQEAIDCLGRSMETNPKSEQSKPRSTFVTVVIVAGIILAVVINLYSLLNSWSMIGYADWEFQPLLSREGIPELFHSVKKCLLVKMLTAIVATACIIFFLIKLLRGKRYGFWGFAVTSVLATAVHVIMSSLVVNAFQKIDVELPYETYQFKSPGRWLPSPYCMLSFRSGKTGRASGGGWNSCRNRTNYILVQL